MPRIDIYIKCAYLCVYGSNSHNIETKHVSSMRTSTLKTISFYCFKGLVIYVYVLSFQLDVSLRIQHIISISFIKEYRDIYMYDVSPKAHRSVNIAARWTNIILYNYNCTLFSFNYKIENSINQISFFVYKRIWKFALCECDYK